MAGRVVSRTLKPFTVEHWRAYSERVILDTDDYWELEPFHIEVIKPILAGVTEVWAVLPEGNTKTTLMAGFALYHCDYTAAPGCRSPRARATRPRSWRRRPTT